MSDCGQLGDIEYRSGDLHSAEPDLETDSNSAFSSQTAGQHYISGGIQPAIYAESWGFGYLESFALKYLTRHGRKNGAEDLDKAIHCLQMLKESRYGRPRTRTGRIR